MDKKKICVLAAIVIGITAGITAFFYASKKSQALLTLTLILIAAAAGFIVAAVIFSRGKAKAESERRYKKKQAYITPAEQEMLRKLRIAAGPKYEVCPQAPLVSVVDKINGGAFRSELFRVIDYVIIDINTAEPKLLVELNDISHNRADRAERDRKVAEICEEAGIPLISFTTEQAADEGYVKKIITKALR